MACHIYWPHLQRMDQDEILNLVWSGQISGPLKIGRPNCTWKTCVQQDVQRLGVTVNDPSGMAHNKSSCIVCRTEGRRSKDANHTTFNRDLPGTYNQWAVAIYSFHIRIQPSYITKLFSFLFIGSCFLSVFNRISAVFHILPYEINPENVDFIFSIQLGIYNRIPFLEYPVVVNPAVRFCRWWLLWILYNSSW